MRLALLPVVLATLALAACDSGDALDPPSPADIAGTYSFEAFRFRPNASALAPVNVLDTLVASDSYVQFFDGGQAILQFRRVGGTTRFVPGDVEVRRDEVRLTFQGGNDATLARLVLPNVLTFERGDGGLLTVTESFTADLEAYDIDRYAGFDAIPGTLTLRLRLTGAE